MKILAEKQSIHCRYLIANEQDLQWGLTVTTVGKQKLGINETYPPKDGHPMRYLFSTEQGRVLDEYQLLYIIQGSGIFTSTSCGLTSINTGNMFMLFPGEWHNYKSNPVTGWEEYWIGFKGENIDNRVKNGFFNKENPIFNVGVLDEVVQLYNQGILIAIEQKTGFQQMLAGIVNHLLGIAFSLNKYAGFENMEVINHINKAKIIFSENFQKDVKPEEIAKQLNMSYSCFRRIFKEYTGFAPAQYLQEIRIQHAKELLTNTNLNIKEIAFESGFENPEYFFTAFKKKTGYTPLKYRNFTQGKGF
mgnify:CR=1 FL=1